MPLRMCRPLSSKAIVDPMTRSFTVRETRISPAVAAAMIRAARCAAGLLGVFGYSAYGATKYAVRGLCDVLRTELKLKGIYVGCVYPTDVDTPQYVGERPFLPEEALSISGTVKPISADAVAVAILKGIDRRRANIFTDPTTAVLDRLVRMAPGLTQRWLDHRVGLATRKQWREGIRQ